MKIKEDKYYWFWVIVMIISFNNIMAQNPSKPKEDEDIVVATNDYINNEKAILVKWFSEDFVPVDGYNLYRKTNNGEWIKINQQAIKIKTEKPAGTFLDNEEENYWKAARNIKPKDVEKAGMIIGLIYLKMIYNFKYAEVMGMGYTDKTVDVGGEYKYMVKTIKNGKEVIVDSSLTIKQGAWEPDAPITKITTERKRKEIQFKFKVEHSRYFSIDYQRKYEGGEFTNRNKAPVLIQKDESGNFPEVVFSDKPINKDTTYTYLVYGVDYFGKRTKPSNELIVSKKDFDPPKPITDLVFDQDTLDVKLTWNPSAEKDEDLKGYHVYRSLHYDKDFEKVNPSLIPKDKTLYLDKVPQPGEYYYMVVAVDAHNNESSGAPLMADVRDVVAPEVPSGIQAVAQSGLVKLTWNPNKEKDLKGYLIFKSLAGKNVFVTVNGIPTKETSYEEKLPKQVKNRFVYKLVALDSSYNRSKYSDSVMVKMPDVFPPAMPLITEISSSSNGIEIKWLGNVENDLAGYKLMRIEKDAQNNTPIVTELISKSNIKFIDNTASKNVHYVYKMIAIDSSGNSSVESKPYPYKWLDMGSLLKIKRFEVKGNDKNKSVKLNWDIQKDANFKGCIVFRGINNGELIQLSGNLEEKLEYQDNNLKPGTYIYMLKIYDKLGNIVKSENKKIVITDTK